MNEKYSIEQFQNFVTITLPRIYRRPIDYLFLIFIICLFYGASNSAFAVFNTVQNLHGPNSVVLIIILVILLLISVFFLMLVYLILRPVAQQKIELHKDHLLFDTGALPLLLTFNLNSTIWHSPSELPHIIKTCFRKKYHFDIEDIKTFKINGFFDPVRLTIKKNSDEIEVGRQLEETEKMRLLNHIKSHYNI